MQSELQTSPVRQVKEINEDSKGALLGIEGSSPVLVKNQVVDLQKVKKHRTIIRSIENIR